MSSAIALKTGPLKNSTDFQIFRAKQKRLAVSLQNSHLALLHLKRTDQEIFTSLVSLMSSLLDLKSLLRNPL